jgi:hypothetical protein
MDLTISLTFPDFSYNFLGAAINSTIHTAVDRPTYEFRRIGGEIHLPIPTLVPKVLALALLPGSVDAAGI